MRNRMCFPAMAFHEIEVKVESVFRQSSDVKQLEQLGICLIPAFGAHSEGRHDIVFACKF